MRAFTVLAVLAAATLPAGAADPQTDKVDAAAIIQKFVQKETDFAKARENYTYRQTLKVQVLDSAGNPTGEQWDLWEDIIFSPDGKRTEKVVYAPVSTLRSIIVSPEDEQDLRNVQPFVMTNSDLPDYQVDYLGREKVDEIGCYVFSIKPKKLMPGKRYFEGQAWVDDRDLQIVKTYGRGVGLLKKGNDQQFPKFETYREQVDGKFWFPTYTFADDTLYFQAGPQRIRMLVKYEDYKQFKSESEIKYGDTAEPPKK